MADLWSRARKQLLRLGGLLLLVLLLGGCVERTDWQALQRQAATPAGDLHGEHTIGQTLVPQHAGLSGIEVVLVDYGAESGRPAVPLELRLCRDLACQEGITRTTVPLSAIVHNSSYRLSFPPQPDSAGRAYVLLAGAPQAGSPARATLWASGSDLYPDGTLLRDGRPAEGDLNFWAYYDSAPADVAAELLRQAGGGLPHMPGLLLLLLAPGYLLARLLPRSRQDDLLELLGTCLGLSAAAVPVLLLLLSWLPGLLSGPAVPVGGGLLAAAALGLLVRDICRGRYRGLAPVSLPVTAALVAIAGIALGLRAFHALDLTGPLWVDAVHHTTLARLIVERGAIPGDYLPYVQVAPATYHFGFQSLVAVLHGLTGMPLPGALLLLGQVLNGLGGLTLYGLGRRWGGSRWAGLAAAAVPSALSLMPAYYISWSRYTELAGLFILPVAAVLLDRLLRGRWHWGLAGVTAVAMAGLVVAHLRVAAFMATLAVLLVLRAMWEGRRSCWAAAVPLGRALAVAAAGFTLIAVWLVPSILDLGRAAMQEWAASEEALSLYYVLFGPGRYLFPAAVAGTLLAVLWRRAKALILLLWAGLLVVLAKPGLIGLPLGAAIDSTSVAIALYVPLSLAAALGVGGLAALARRVRWTDPPLLRWAGAVFLIGTCAWGASELNSIVNPRTAILAPADLPAMAWIEENTAPDAVFLVNSYEWMTAVYAGSDGGYWIAPLAGRQTWPPPALYGLGAREHIEEINDVAREAMASPGGEALYTLLRDHGISHVYLGRYGGPLTAEKLLGCDRFRPVYRQGGVWVFALEP